MVTLTYVACNIHTLGSQTTTVTLKYHVTNIIPGEGQTKDHGTHRKGATGSTLKYQVIKFIRTLVHDKWCIMIGWTLLRYYNGQH